VESSPALPTERSIGGEDLFLKLLIIFPYHEGHLSFQMGLPIGKCFGTELVLLYIYPIYPKYPFLMHKILELAIYNKEDHP